MNKYIALLRGINVSGQKKIKMADLKSILSDSGLSSVETYIQSGNVIFESDQEPKALQEVIEKVILENYSFEVPTLVIAKDDLRKLIPQNPFLNEVDDTKKLYVCFLLEEPTAERIQILADLDLKGDEYVLQNRVLYTCYHNGAGKSKVSNNFLEAKLKVKATMRNWRTVNILAEL